MKPTRLIEDPDEYYRASVVSAEVLEVGNNSVILKTRAAMQSKKPVSSADSEMLSRLRLSAVGESVEGRLRIDAVSDDVFRFRYAEGCAVPENNTLMVVGRPAKCRRCRIHAVSDRVRIRTDKAALDVHLSPYRVEASDLRGRKLCGISGPEKDNFACWDAVNTGICRRRSDGRPAAVECFDLRPGEAVYGFGERFTRLNKAGQTVDLDMVDALGVTTPRSYKNIPLFMSTSGYGVFFNHSCLMTFYVGSRSSVDIQGVLDDDFLDYYVFLGDMKTILSLYTDVTGKGSLPPKWTFGYWQSKISYKSADETLEIARKLREHDVPCDVIHLDTHWYREDWYCDLEFAPDRFPDPAGYLSELARMGFKVSLWQLPYIPSGSKLFEDLKAVDGFVKKSDGSIYDCGICFTPGFREKGGVVGVVDYTNPEAVRVHQDAFRRLFRLGAKVIKTDFGEAAPLDGVYHDGTPGHRMHNLYPLLYNRAIFDVTKEETGEGVVWARSAWAGNQRYPLHWGGDNSPNWHNIIPQMEGGLSFGLSGFQFWSQDIGGFCGKVDEPLLVRWMQAAMFLSHSRIHGFGDREIYKFSRKTFLLCREYIRLRYRLLPYIYGSARRCVEQSLPLMRPLALEFQDDPNTWNIGDEWLFGEHILVAPIFSPDGRRRAYLPQGEWTDWWTGRRFAGRTWLDLEAAEDRIPLFLREGAVVPMGPFMPYVDAEPVREIEIRVAPFTKKGKTRLDIHVNGNWIPVVYECSRSGHVLKAAAAGVRFKVKMMGRPAPPARMAAG